MIKIGLKEQLIPVILRLILILILTVGSVFYLVNQSISRAASIKEKRTLLAIWDQKTESLTRLQADYKVIETNLPVLEQALPKSDDLFVYFNKLDQLAKKNGLVQQLTIGQQITSATDSEPAGMIFRAAIDGTLPNFLNYIREAEKMPNFVKFSELSAVGVQGLYVPSRINYSGKIYTAPTVIK